MMEMTTNAINWVEAAGGKVLMEKTLVAPGMGYYANLLDSEGNKVALHSPN